MPAPAHELPDREARRAYAWSLPTLTPEELDALCDVLAQIELRRCRRAADAGGSATSTA